VYPGVPPLAEAVAVPLLPPKQLTAPVVMLITIGGGSRMSGLVVAFDWHPFASSTVTVYDPADKPVAVGVVPPEGIQLYVKGPVPPATPTLAAPSDPPLQLTLMMEKMVAVGPELSFTFTHCV